MKLFYVILAVLIILNNVTDSLSQRFKLPPSRGNGPSGKPKDHFKDMNSKKAAEDAARNAGKGNPPIHHQPHKPGQKPHYHPADKNGEKKNSGQHFSYPKKFGK